MTTFNQAYPLAVRPLSAAEGCGVLAYFPSLPGCYGDGETIVDAINDLEDATEALLRSAAKHRDTIPEC